MPHHHPSVNPKKSAFLLYLFWREPVKHMVRQPEKLRDFLNIPLLQYHRPSAVEQVLYFTAEPIDIERLGDHRLLVNPLGYDTQLVVAGAE